MRSSADRIRSPRARAPRRPAALGVALALVTVLVPAAAVPSAAEDAPSGWIDAPALTLLVDDAQTGTVEPTTTGGAFTAPANTDFVLDFDGTVDAATREVVTAAAGIWSAALEVRVPIAVDVTMTPMAPGMLGAAGPSRAYYGQPAFPARDVLYPVALANQLVGRDLDAAAADIEMELSSSMTWDRSVDGTVSSGQPMLSVAVHELGHGLGHTSWVRSSGSGWTVNYLRDGLTLATPYDRLVTTPSGTPITSLVESGVTAAVTSPLVWGGSRGRSANGGVAPALYSPPVFEVGSSIGHLDEATFRSEVMTPFLGRSEVHTTIPSITRAMLADIGWGLQVATSTPTTSSGTGTSTPTPVASTATQRATAFVEAVVTDFLGRPATSAEITRWRDHLLAGGSREAVTRAFAYSDEWIGVLVDGLYRSTLGRSADAGGRAFWIDQLRRGMTPAQVASHFYASDEYFRRAGGTAPAWVADLYAEILDRGADPAGLAFWVARAGSVARPAISLDFYQSLESRRDRVDALFGTLLGRDPDPSGWSFWAGVLSNGRDLDLAMFLAASDEYAARATSRFA
ncbi:MAG TPA: DUF4214 domain-containing protein [Acidimicrobiales bacterium]|nr:DUF4214 domain-containing protein [Acidimicrobiales bacterium]